MNIAKHKSEIVVAVCAFFLSVLLNQYIFSPPKTPSVTTSVKAIYIPSPTPTAVYIPESVDSPDGTKTLTMTQEAHNGNVIYSFIAVDNRTNEEYLVATKTATLNSFSLPENSWSPDNTYAFIKENTSTQSGYFVLASKETLAFSDLKDVDIQVLFSQKYPQYALSDITGWAAPYLLILNTNTNEGEHGPSFWFDISTSSFIRLGRQF